MVTSEDCIKIVSINTWKCDGHYAERMNVLAKQLKALEPSVIVCQECFMTADTQVNTLELLGESLKMNAVLTPARRKIRPFANGLFNSISGLGILSAFPLKLVKELDLPSSVEDGGRKAQFAAITLKTKMLLFVNIHLSHLKHGAMLRIEQLHVIANELLSLKDYDFKIICGDFNAEKNSPEFNFLRTSLNIEDCYSLGGGLEPRLNTETQNNFQLHKSVDHIVALPDKNGCYPICTNSSLVLYKPDPDSGLYASDHPGITTTLHFPTLFG